MGRRDPGRDSSNICITGKGSKVFLPRRSSSTLVKGLKNDKTTPLTEEEWEALEDAKALDNREVYLWLFLGFISMLLTAPLYMGDLLGWTRTQRQPMAPNLECLHACQCACPCDNLGDPLLEPGRF